MFSLYTYIYIYVYRYLMEWSDNNMPLEATDMWSTCIKWSMICSAFPSCRQAEAISFLGFSGLCFLAAVHLWI